MKVHNKTKHGNTGRKHTKEALEKMRIARIGKKHSEETKNKIRLALKGYPYKGKKHSKEWKRNISRSLIGREFTEEHRKNIGLSNKGKLSGSKSHLWKGGITPINIQIRTSTQYKQWRKSVFDRDKYTCVMCGDKTSGNLEADHIKPFSLFHDLRFDLQNGRTLCRECHRNTNTYGNKIRTYSI